MASQKIAVYSLSDLKNTTDDALPNYLKSIGFIQSHVLTDIRLGLGYLAVLLSAATFYLDYTTTWSENKTVTLYAVIVYFTLNSALTLWIWGIEKGKIYTGSKEETLVSFAAHVSKHVPRYSLTVRYSDPKESTTFDWKTIDIEAPFAKWFSPDGQFVTEPFQQWLASEVSFVETATVAHRAKQGRS